MGPLPLTPTGFFGCRVLALWTISGWISLFWVVKVSTPAARLDTTSAASLPPSTAPSILPRNFCDVQSPARVKLGMGVFWEGRYLLRPGTAAYTDLGTFTTVLQELGLGPIGCDLCREEACQLLHGGSDDVFLALGDPVDVTARDG